MSAHAGSTPTLPVLPTSLLRRMPGNRTADEFTQTAAESPGQLAWRRLRENRIAIVAATIFTVMVVMCLSAGLFERHWAGRTAAEQNLGGPMQVAGRKQEVVDLRGIPAVGPGMRREYTFGADPLGRDVFMRTLRGGQVSLMVGLGAALITVVFGLLLGVSAGYYGGRVDSVVSRSLDVLIAFPSIVFAVSLSTALATGDGFWIIQRGSPALPLLIIGCLGSFGFARVVRAKAMEVAKKDFIEAARALGADNRRIMRKELLPHLATTVITWFGLIVSANIIAEAGLSFLGVGVLPPTPSWGNIIADGRIFYSTAWWISFFPGLMILCTVLCLNLVGEAVEEAFDPKSGGR